jgi:hypothetical protein
MKDQERTLAVRFGCKHLENQRGNAAQLTAEPGLNRTPQLSLAANSAALPFSPSASIKNAHR